MSGAWRRKTAHRLLGCLSGFHGTARQLLEYSGWLLGYPGWLLGCSHAVARVIVVVAMVSGGVARVLLGSW